MSTSLLVLPTNAMHGPMVFTLKTSVCNAYINIHSHRMMATSPLLTHDLLDICIF